MATPCPKCGKSIRQGAKFCGFCGHILGDPGTGQPLAAAPPEQRSVGNPCPHCGKLNRQGVKFCASCGKGLAPLSAGSPPTPPPSPGPVRPSKPKRSRLVTFGFLAAVAVVVCGSLFGIAWGTGLLDGILPEKTPAGPEVASGDTGTLVPTTTDSQTLAPIITTAATLLDTPTPTETLVVFTPTQQPTETPLPTITNTPEPNILLKDDFNGDLGLWEGWSQRPLSILDGIFPAEISLGEYLEMMGMDYKAVGVTSIQTVTLESGLVIDFSAEADNYFNPSIYLDWNPGIESRQPFRIGPLYLEVNNTEVVFHYKNKDIDQECSASINGTGMRLYRIEFGPDWEVKVFMDNGGLLEICSVTIDEPYDVVGKLTFSGFGLVDSIVVTGP
jgi:hypothetical protein